MKYKELKKKEFFKDAVDYQNKLKLTDKTIDYSEYIIFKEWFIEEAKLLFKAFSDRLILKLWDEFQESYGLNLTKKTKNNATRKKT